MPEIRKIKVNPDFKEFKAKLHKEPDVPEDYARVLDKGYVGLIDFYGSDRGKVSPPSAARVSFKKRASEFTDLQNDKLINYLIEHNEYSCFRHNVMTFEIRMPLLVARQFYKYVVASNWTEDQLAWNENSKRYITEENVFYIPKENEWRKAPENKKQGSAEAASREIGEYYTNALIDWTQEGESLYQNALKDGLAPELARLFSANGNYITAVWTASLNSIFHMLDERLDHVAQWEIQQYARQVANFVNQSFPKCYEAWSAYKTEERLKNLCFDEVKVLTKRVAELEDERDSLKQELAKHNRSWLERLFGV